VPAAADAGVPEIDSPASAGAKEGEMFFHLPFGHTEVRVDSRDPRKNGAVSALDIIRRTRGRRS
jgi:hypothetical protein